MVKRGYSLPGIEELSKEQDRALSLPAGGRHLVVGGPGTGKSVLALLRARRHKRAGDQYLFLVYNHLLNRASVEMFGGELESKTWEGWFRGLYSDICGEPIPVLDASGESGFRAIDWRGVEDGIFALERIPEFERPCLVIDEGQDMPREFYASLVSLGFEDFYVVLDQNQQITEQNSSRLDIVQLLDIDADAVIELQKNYRNAWPVARLARAFYTGDPATPPPELPTRVTASPPILYVYEEDCLERIAKGILRLADRDTRQLIGVLAPSNAVRERYYTALRSADVRLDNTRPPVETFHSSHRPNIVFSKGGIVVINAQACKGLEFDTAVLADIDGHYFRHSDPHQAKRLFYVMVARARERVVLLMNGKSAQVPNLNKLLPDDRAVLQRKAL